MDSRAIYKYARVSPTKCRLVADMIRGLNAHSALNELEFQRRAGSEEIAKVLRSAIANAVSNYDADENTLWIKSIQVNKSFVMKRWMPRAKGRATPKLKRQSHITVIVSDSNKV